MRTDPAKSITENTWSSSSLLSSSGSSSEWVLSYSSVSFPVLPMDFSCAFCNCWKTDFDSHSDRSLLSIRFKHSHTCKIKSGMWLDVQPKFTKTKSSILCAVGISCNINIGIVEELRKISVVSILYKKAHFNSLISR